LNAIPPSLAEEAGRLAEWFLHDPDPWSGNRIPHGELRRIARSIRHRRTIEITVGHDAPVTVRPLGLVLKQGSWNLISLGTATVDVIPIDRLRATRLTTQLFTPPAEFNLTDFWRRHVAATTPIAAG
jgi:hypothetical protein